MKVSGKGPKVQDRQLLRVGKTMMVIKDREPLGYREGRLSKWIAYHVCMPT